MKRGFTMLELLVASLLLGMLMTILTMVFNQSSIAWRTGVAGVSDLDDVRETVSGVRYKADNAYPSVMDGTLMQVGSVFGSNGKVLQNRADYVSEFDGSLPTVVSDVSDTDVSQSYKTGIGCGSESQKNPSDTYVINVMSAGPDGKMDTYDDIWSFPDDPEEWCK